MQTGVVHMQSGLYGLRWRTKTEVVEGRGQFSCGCKGCDQRQQLASYELPFSYKEGGQQRQALVKVSTQLYKNMAPVGQVWTGLVSSALARGCTALHDTSLCSPP